jgi:3-dehydroquinate synthase
MLAPLLSVRHARGTCPVYVARGALRSLATLAAVHLPGRRLAVISDDRVAAVVPCPIEAPRFLFPAGEGSKTREQWARLTDQLIVAGFGRDSGLVAVGGGVTGDLAGFVAATYLRGVPLLIVPTTLLAMLDASIGGKTGVDTASGKNLVGAFHQPVAVVSDPDTLTTLPDEELGTGFAEAVKHALIADADHFAWLEASANRLLGRDPDALEALVRRSAAIKAAIVEADEHEAGRRAWLNAGHTVGHALETGSAYQLRHGDAVAIGLVVEARAAEAEGIAEPGTATALERVLQRFCLPTRVPPQISLEASVDAMQLDKKNRNGVVHCVFPARVGTMSGGTGEGWTHPISVHVIRRILDQAH